MNEPQPRKRKIADHAEQIANQRDHWISRNSAYYQNDRRYMQFLVRPHARVLDLGCGSGELLASLMPSVGVGVDLSPAMVEIARGKYPGLDFRVGDAEDESFIQSLGGPFDYIILSDTIGLFDDIDRALTLLHAVCNRETRLIISYYAQLWEPLLKFAEVTSLRMPQP